MKLRKRSEERGFTLIEIMVVIIILSCIAALVGPEVFKRLKRSKRIAAKTQIEMLGVSLDQYRLDNGRYPTTEQGLEALRTMPLIEPVPKDWNGPYLRKAVPLDPWGNPYCYLCPGRENPDGYDLFSLGADGVEGGVGDGEDIKSWEDLHRTR
jgi:general secretion pathway protein G